MTTEQQTWIVMEGRAGITPFWGWCRWAGGPKFEDLVLTATDGMSDPPDIDSTQIRLEKFLFMVNDGPTWEPVEVGSMLEQAWEPPTRTPMEHLAALLTEVGLPAVLDDLAALDPDGMTEKLRPTLKLDDAVPVAKP